MTTYYVAKSAHHNSFLSVDDSDGYLNMSWEHESDATRFETLERAEYYASKWKFPCVIGTIEVEVGPWKAIEQ